MIIASISKVSDIVNNGLEILKRSWTTESMLIQLVATIVLVLAVRYLFWDKITAILEEKELIDEGLLAKDEAQQEALHSRRK